MQEVASSAAASAPARESNRIGPLQIAGAAVVLGFFLYFVLPGLRAPFAEDDMMNIYYCWNPGPWKLIKGLVLFFTTYYRPMGGVFYSIIYHLFGLNPLAYHIGVAVLLLINVYLTFRLTVELSGSQLLGGLTALLVAYHAQLGWMVYITSFIYDVLCFTFYILALTYYVKVRNRGSLLNWKQALVFLLLYIGALDAKEMAVTLPVMVLLYEAIWHPPSGWRLRELSAWVRREAVVPLIAGVLTAVYIAGKTLGPGALSAMDAYRPTFTWPRYVESTGKFLNTFFYQPMSDGFFTGAVKVLLMWTGLVLLALFIKRKHFTLMVGLVIVAPLPITFIPDRGGSCLYIPLVGWAMLLGTLFLGLCQLITKLPLVRRAPAKITVAVLVVAAVGLVWRETIHQNKKVLPSYESFGRVTRSMLEQMRAIQPHVPPNSKVIFLNNAFEGWDLKFIAELTFGDRSVNVWLQDKQPLPPAEVNAMDYIFEIRNGKIVRLKPPM